MSEKNFKLVCHEELVKMYYGKKGTKKRDKFEAELAKEIENEKKMT